MYNIWEIKTGVSPGLGVSSIWGVGRGCIKTSNGRRDCWKHKIPWIHILGIYFMNHYLEMIWLNFQLILVGFYAETWKDVWRWSHFIREIELWSKIILDFSRVILKERNEVQSRGLKKLIKVWQEHDRMDSNKGHLVKWSSLNTKQSIQNLCTDQVQ